MISAVKKARIGLLVYSLLGIIAIGATYITDFAKNDTITWSGYVIAAVPVVFVSILPMCFAFKYNKLLSLGVLSVASLGLLYLLDRVTLGTTWFGELAFPIAVQALASIWISGIILRFVRLNKWFLSAALLAVLGTPLILCISWRLDNFIQKGAPPLINIIGIFAVAVAAVALCILGYIQITVKHRKANALKAAEIEADTPAERPGSGIAQQPTH